MYRNFIFDMLVNRGPPYSCFEGHVKKLICTHYRYFSTDNFAENFNAELRKKLGKEIEVSYKIILTSKLKTAYLPLDVE